MTLSMKRVSRLSSLTMLEKDYKRSRIRLTEVSRDFNKYREEDIKIAYEAAIAFQLQLTIAREKENNLKDSPQ